MLPDRSVTAMDVLDANRLIRAMGVRRAVRRLESVEPELAGFFMEAATELYAELDDSVTQHGRAKEIHRNAVLLALVSIEAVRRSA
ncbi:MAG TPA: hypothetical protein VGR35_11760 [Tepidisphaeraceae bacterium]|nr:hypothetical protein [Tepidisphaeraceae bacterium]